MNPTLTIALLAAAGVALVVQNFLMVRISEAASTVVISLVINSAVGLVLLVGVLLWCSGVAGLSETLGVFRPWAILPGLLGSFFVFAGVMGYQRVGAATTISVLVASQLVAGLAADAFKADARPGAAAMLGVLLLIAGAFLVARQRI